MKCFTSLRELQGENDSFLPDVLIILLADSSNDLVKAPLNACFHGYERAPDLRPEFRPAPNES